MYVPPPLVKWKNPIAIEIAQVGQTGPQENSSVQDGDAFWAVKEVSSNAV